VVSVVKAATDITAEKLQALENEAKMKALSQVQAIIEFKPSGEIIDANDNFFTAMGYRREDVIGRHHRMFVEPNYAASEDYRAFWRRLKAREPIADSFHRLGAGGRKVWLQASGKVAEISTLARSIASGAEEQNAALAEEANAAVESMKQQILRLTDAVGQFRLSGGAEAAHAAPRGAQPKRRAA
jgi:methyl-accepting chemotaxis protein